MLMQAPGGTCAPACTCWRAMLLQLRATTTPRGRLVAWMALAKVSRVTLPREGRGSVPQRSSLVLVDDLCDALACAQQGVQVKFLCGCQAQPAAQQGRGKESKKHFHAGFLEC